jgi:hypothetical protein
LDLSEILVIKFKKWFIFGEFDENRTTETKKGEIETGDWAMRHP